MLKAGKVNLDPETINIMDVTGKLIYSRANFESAKCSNITKNWEEDIYFIYTPPQELQVTPNLIKSYQSEIQPNPAKTHINYRSIARGNAIQSAILYDIQGKKLFASQRSGNGRIDVKSYPRGVYLVELIHQNGKKDIHKVILK